MSKIVLTFVAVLLVLYNVEVFVFFDRYAIGVNIVLEVIDWWRFGVVNFINCLKALISLS